MGKKRRGSKKPAANAGAPAPAPAPAPDGGALTDDEVVGKVKTVLASDDAPQPTVRCWLVQQSQQSLLFFFFLFFLLYSWDWLFLS